jgi:hypothetical protein
MFGVVPTPYTGEKTKCEIDNLSLYVDVIKKTELSKDDVIFVKIKSSTMGINARLLSQIMEKHFPDNEVIIVDDSIDLEVVRKKDESI